MAEHETKFVFPAANSGNLIKWLKSRCVEDGEYPLGVISSVYYDTIDWNFLHEKINSDYLKTKIRLRWYQDVDTLAFSPRAYFEKKEKIGSSRRKDRAPLAMHDAIRSCRYLNDPFFMELPVKLLATKICAARAILPVYQISYIRHRFVDNFTGARLAVDYGIHVPRINPMMIKKENSSTLTTSVFEYKSDSIDLPDWLHGITLFGCRKGAFSKYSNCYEHVTTNPF